jgi:hypothetical protein
MKVKRLNKAVDKRSYKLRYKGIQPKITEKPCQTFKQAGKQLTESLSRIIENR